MENLKYITLVKGIHIIRDENNVTSIVPVEYTWKIGNKLLKEGEVIEKGDIVLAKVMRKDKKITCKPVMVIDVVEEVKTKKNKKHRDIVKIIDKANKAK